MVRIRGVLGGLIACALFGAPTAARADDPSRGVEVDLQLVLAVDVSFSIGIDERDVQRLSYIDAFRDTRIASAMTSGPNRRIAVTYVEWAEADYQRVVIPWRVISSRADAARFADDLEHSPVRRSGATSISSALRFSAALFLRNGFYSDRLVIDISGDGLNNDGEPVLVARDSIEALGITVNALPLSSTQSDLSPQELTDYYSTCVSAGPGAFTLPAVSTDDFALAMQRKIHAELAALTPWYAYRRARPQIWNASTGQVDCLAGERQLREKYLDMLRDLTNGRPERWQPDKQVWPKP